MATDQESPQQLSVEPDAKLGGVEELLSNINCTPGLREWVTPESVALAPIPVKREDSWGIMSLLAVPTQLENGSKGFLAPWGAVEWNWTEKKVTQMIDLRLRDETASLRGSKTISALPADKKITLEPMDSTHREKALFHALNELLSTPPSTQTDLTPLAEHYAGILPSEVYPYYWVLNSASKDWLHHSVSAAALTSTQQIGEELIQDTTAKKKEQHGTQQSLPTPPQLLKPPSDLTKQIGPWLRRSLALAESSSREVASELQALDARWRLPGFRLAFVGEFSRGKSSLLNSLLGRSLLPVGALPTTATLTSIVAGPEDRMEVRFSKDNQEVRSLEKSSWKDLLAIDRAGNDNELSAEVQLTLNHPWLRSLDVELIDTPGAGDLSGHRAAVLFDLLSQCDATVLLVSAAMPFSMTEASFLTQEVIGRHIPCILVVVSKLDTLPEQERPKILNVIRDRVAQISTAIPVLPLHPVDTTATAQETLEAVRAQIEAMVARSDRRAWRSRQVAEQIADHLDHLMEIGSTAIAAIRMSAAERQKALEKAQAETSKVELEWERIRLELDKRRLQLDQKLQLDITVAKTELLETLSLELRKTPDPKSWWERDLPFRMRRELIALGRKSETYILTAIARDFEWLQTEVARIFGTKLARQAADSQETTEIASDLRELQLSDMKLYRLLTRIGSGAAMASMSLIGGPVGIAASVTVGILVDQLLTQSLEKQRHLLAQELTPSVDRGIEEYCSGVSDRLRQLYHQLIEQMTQGQTAWRTAKDAALKTAGSESNEKACQQIIDQASALRKDIYTALKQ